MAGATLELLQKFNVKRDYKELTDEELNMPQYFEPGEWEQTSDYEKRRLSNLARNHFFMTFMGWKKAENKPDFMLTKQQRAGRKRAAERQEAKENEPDKDWKPGCENRKKEFDPDAPIRPKRKRSASATVSKPPLEPVASTSADTDGAAVAASRDEQQIQPTRVMKAVIVHDKKRVTRKKQPEPTRRSSRNVERVSYAEHPDEDRFIYCEQCELEVLDECKIHSFDNVQDTTPDGKRRTPKFAEKTLPASLEVRESSIADAGLGVFALEDIPINTRFGPYTGEQRDVDSDAKDSGYAWAIYDDDIKLSHYVDARDPSKSNWMRYCNCPMQESKQNLSPFQYHGEIYYKVSRLIKAGEELLVWYGDEYAMDLGLFNQAAETEAEQSDTAGVDNVQALIDDANMMAESSDDSDDDDSDDDSDVESDTSSDESSDTDDGFVVPTKPATKRRVIVKAASSVTSDTAHSVPTNVTRVTTRKYIPLAGNTRDLTEVPDLTNVYNHETKRYSCPCCIHQLNNGYLQINQLVTHIMNEHDSLDSSLFRQIMTSLYDLDVKISSSTVNASVERIGIKSDVCDEDKTCGICSKTFSNDGNLLAHAVVHTGEKRYRCDECGKGFSHIHHLKSHHRVHTGEKPYKCEHCHKAFTLLGNLNKHVSTVHGDTRFTCDICSKRFTQRAHLQIHKRIHTGDKPYKCTVCDYACNRSESLKIHMRVHTGDKPYKCTVCDYACNQSQHMRIHMRTHTGDKPYKCTVCDYACNQSQHMRIHMRIHTGDKPYKCTVCDYACNQSQHMRIHMRIHTGDKPYQCDICGDRFNVSANRNRHIKQVHGADKR